MRFMLSRSCLFFFNVLTFIRCFQFLFLFLIIIFISSDFSLFFMVEEGKSAIFAFHYRLQEWELSQEDALSRKGYSTIDFVTTSDELMERHAALMQSGRGPYDFYAMDLNLGNPRGDDFSAACALYDL